MEYALNDLSHHVIVKTPERNLSMSIESTQELFGTTPPVNNSEGDWKEYISKK